jgi:hypothetical protein
MPCSLRGVDVVMKPGGAASHQKQLAPSRGTQEEANVKLCEVPLSQDARSSASICSSEARSSATTAL